MTVLNRLGRTDKWFLGGGKGALYAPPFPRFLAVPGFWDESFLADIRLQRLFTVLFTDNHGRPIPFDSRLVSWRPDVAVFRHEAADRCIEERRCVLASHAWISQFHLLAGPDLEAFVWSLQDVKPEGFGTPWSSLVGCEVLEASTAFEIHTRWPEELEPDRSATERETLSSSRGSMRPPVAVFCEVGADAPRLGATVNHAQTHDDSPLYACSVLPEKFVRGRLAGDFKFHPGSAGMLHVVQHFSLGRSKPLTVSCGAGLSKEEAQANLKASLQPDPVARSTDAWTAYFASVPQFDCSDDHLTNAYWYRWYGLRLNTVDMPGLPGLGRPFVTEGIGFFRNFVTYSAQAHLREASWMRSPELAVGILDNLVSCQRTDCSYPGHNYSGRPSRDFYHADFGSAAVQLESLHPGSVRPRHVDSLRRYAEYFDAARGSRHGAGTVYDIFDQNETGQEYMSRYLFARPDADEWVSFRVGGVDATAYLADLQWALARLDSDRWESVLDQTLEGLAGACWDAESLFFCDVDAAGNRSPSRPGTGLYPMRLQSLSELARRIPSADLTSSLRKWLLDPEEFWLEQGFPATAKSDPTFCAEAEWKDVRLNCPWNGRSWPMTNSHLVDALAQAARTLEPSLRVKAGEALLKAVRLLFHDGDPTRPCVYEHFNPETGSPALYRGYDDYMHSWVVDLILRHAVGVQPQLGEGLAFDPLPLGLDRIECAGIPEGSGACDVEIVRGKAAVHRTPPARA